MKPGSRITEYDLQRDACGAWRSSAASHHPKALGAIAAVCGECQGSEQDILQKTGSVGMGAGLS